MSAVHNTSVSTPKNPEGRLLRFPIGAVLVELELGENDSSREGGELRSMQLSRSDLRKVARRILGARVSSIVDAEHGVQALEHVVSELSSEHAFLLVDHIVEGLPVEILAANHDMSTRSVQRMLKKAKGVGRDLLEEIAEPGLAEVVPFPDRQRLTAAA